MLNVVCVWVRGHVPFTLEYVTKLHSMTTRYVRQPFTFTCLTDQPQVIPRHIEAQRIGTPHAVKGWWSKIELFKPGRFTGRVLYLDLDVLLINSLDSIINYPAPFALAPDGAPNFQPADGLAVIKRFNSSVMVWDAECNSEIYTHWSADVSRRLWGDQDWIGEQCPNAAPMPIEWFPRLSTDRSKWPVDAKVVLCKRPKNEHAGMLWPWFAEAWR